jgi:hypothetical protein
MGLDMYLYAERYVANYDFYSKEERKIYTDVLETVGEDRFLQYDESFLIKFTAMYWRKANHIHKWFVDNVQSGIDNCGMYAVGITHLTDLRNLCLKVQDNPKQASELLPRFDGFFFGSTEYDDYYYDTIKETEYRLTELLSKLDNRDGIYFYYHSSW